jgi:hypothetical protein
MTHWLGQWPLTFLRHVVEEGTQRQMSVDQSGRQASMRLAAAVPEREGGRRSARQMSGSPASAHG